MSKKKPVCSVEKTIAGIAQAIHEVREEGESTDRLVGTLSKGVAALTVRVESTDRLADIVSKGLAALTVRIEELERESTRQAMEIFDLRTPPRTWLQFLRGE